MVWYLQRSCFRMPVRTSWSCKNSHTILREITGFDGPKNVNFVIFQPEEEYCEYSSFFFYVEKSDSNLMTLLLMLCPLCIGHCFRCNCSQIFRNPYGHWSRILQRTDKKSQHAAFLPCPFPELHRLLCGRLARLDLLTSKTGLWAVLIHEIILHPNTRHEKTPDL